MKKFLIGFVGVVVALVIAALVVPSFLDWNQYKADIAKLVESATGRKIDIRGNVSMAVLPSPSLSVADVRLSNVPGAAVKDMVRLDSLEVHVALLPLIGGHVQISSVKLVRPVIELETLADGGVNWQFHPASEKSNGAKPGTAPAGANGENAGGPGQEGFGTLQVDHFSIENGTVVYRDTRAKTVERVENINGRASLASLTGPIDASGSAVVRGIPLSFDGSIGAVIQGRTVTVSLDVKVIPGDVQGKFNGALVNLAEAPGIKGTVSLKGADLGGFVSALTGAAAPPQIAGRRFGVSAAINSSQTLAEVKDLELTLDGMTARGTASAELGKKVDAEIDLTVGRVNLDKMLAAAKTPRAAKKPTPANKPGRVTAPIAPAKPANGGVPASLPKNISAAVNITVEALTYQKIAIRQARLSATLANGEITLSQLSALLPGATDFAAFGFITLPKGQPRYEGDVELRTNDLRGALDSFGIQIPGIAPERLHQLAFKSNVRVDLESLSADKIDLKIDGTKVTGTATATLGARPTVNADVTVDKINLDAYLPKSAGGGGAAKSSATAGGGQGTPSSPSKSAAANDLPFDAHVKARVKSLTFQSVPVHELRVDAALNHGNLTLRSMTVENAAGIALAARGSVANVTGGIAAMSLSDVAFDVRSNDLSQAAEIAGIALPMSPRNLGKVAMSGTASGSLDALSVDTKLTAASGEFSFAGKVRPLDAGAPLDGRVALQHPDVNRLLRALAVAYKPAGKIGGINIAAKLVGGPARMDLTAIDGTVGKTEIKGAAAIDLSGAKPSINASLGVGVLDITPLLPAKQTASLEIRPRLIPAAWRGGPLLDPGLGGRRNGGIELIAAPWNNQAIDVSALGALNAILKVNARALIYDNIRLDDAVIDTALQNGVFDAKRLTGTLYGGQLAATGQLAARGADADLRTNVSLKGTDLGGLMRALGEGPVESGRLDFNANLSTLGHSSAALASRLNGQGQFAITGARGGERTFLSGLLGLMGALNQLVPLLGSQKSGATDVSGSFQIANGVATSQDLKLASSAGNGTAAASVNLPAWTIDAKGEIKLASGLVSVLLVDKVGVAPTLPFTVRGPLDDPKYTFDISKLPGRSIKIPGLDKLRKTPGVGTILNQLLPTGEESAPVQAPGTATQSVPGALPVPPPAPTQQQQQPQKVKPKNLLKGLLKDLKR